MWKSAISLAHYLHETEKDAVDLFLDGCQYDCRMRIFLARRHTTATAIFFAIRSRYSGPMPDGRWAFFALPLHIHSAHSFVFFFFFQFSLCRTTGNSYIRLDFSLSLIIINMRAAWKKIEWQNEAHEKCNGRPRMHGARSVVERRDPRAIPNHSSLRIMVDCPSFASGDWASSNALRISEGDVRRATENNNNNIIQR